MYVLERVGSPHRQGVRAGRRDSRPGVAEGISRVASCAGTGTQASSASRVPALPGLATEVMPQGGDSHGQNDASDNETGTVASVATAMTPFDAENLPLSFGGDGENGMDRPTQ